MAVLLVAALLIVRMRKGSNSNNNNSSSRSTSSQAGATDVDRNRGFDRRASFLEYTKHARCRMSCREITETEVQDIMKTGIINYRKSNASGHPCPTYAVEGYTHDAQHVRIVFAQCDRSTKVVTCIDLEKEWQCHCPGDDKKYENQER